MAHPKRQHSKQRSRKRRTHDNLTAVNLNPCGHCQKPVISHRVCPYCGYYKGSPVIVSVKPEEAKA
ncbi:MAG: 50S ribosomal protein L32 [Candidatus Omnitrophota bacterium]